jgi:hypothetical protein
MVDATSDWWKARSASMAVIGLERESIFFLKGA